ncbi:hypothetical protein HUT18_24890 [Streptomyces sp. NA04227]|uniref:hypothetical protein n=1 Tax=Streptomyces sp. NA04227 TaxID=2742136 RepID=UPI00159132A6|nr:hypothetical protein [Streptomyces sp. NA04227]QKW09136.1 hypothetical protein HUT18_24890 [Streptomyces sp. NA04227]
MTGPHESSEPGTAPNGGASAAAPGGHKRGSTPARVARSIVSGVLLVLTCVLVPLALIGVWLHGIALDTDRYVATVKPLASEPAVEDVAVRRITHAANVRVDGNRTAADIAAWMESRGLPPRAAEAVKGLGPQLDAAVSSTAEKVATRFVRSDRFERIWAASNRKAHAAVVDALTGEGRGAVGVNDGTVTLDVGQAVDQVRETLVDAGLSPAAKIPDSHKQMVLVQSDQLEKVRDGAQLLDEIGNWLPAMAAVTGAAGLLLAHRRRRALARTALGAAFACLVVAIALVVARRYYLDHLPPRVQSDAAAAVIFDTLLRFLRVSLRTAIVLGVVVALAAYLVGPGRLPRAVRGTSERAADSAARWAFAHQIRTGRAGTWAQTHRRWLTTAALLIVALVFALWNHPTVASVLLLLVVLLALLALVALLAASGRATMQAERGAPSGPGEVP